MAINFDFADALTPHGRKLRQLQLDEAQAKVDSGKRQMEAQDAIMALLNQSPQGQGPTATAGVGGAMQRTPQPQPQPQAGGQPNPLSAIAGNPIAKLAFIRMLQSSPAAAFRAATGGGSAGQKPSRTVSLGGLGQPIDPVKGQPQFTIPDTQAANMAARAKVWTNTFEKQHTEDLMKIQKAFSDRLSGLDLLTDQLASVNRAKDFKESTGAFAGAATLYSKVLKGKMADLQDKGLSGALDSFFNTPNVNKKSLQQIASMVYKARKAERDAVEKQMDTLNHAYLDQKLKFFSSPMMIAPETPESPEPAEVTVDAAE